MSEINWDALSDIVPASSAESRAIQGRLETQQPPFVSEEHCLAVLAFGGTVQSAYVPELETITPVAMNPALARHEELGAQFKIAQRETTGAILVAKDSRLLDEADIIFLVHVIKHIKNRKVVVTCGTYKLPKISQVLDDHFGQGKSDKIIGITGSMLPASVIKNDLDYNVGGTIAALEAFDSVKVKGMVFAQFHGHIFSGEALKTLNLHPPGVSPRFTFPSI